MKVTNTTESTENTSGVGHVLTSGHSAKLRLDEADTDKTEKLSKGDSAKLAKLEEKIELYEKGFVEAGEALGRIRAEKLHRATHGTFDQYCKDRWGFSPQRADQLIKGAAVAEAIAAAAKTKGLPEVENEAQARALGRIEAQEDMESAWELAVERAKGKRVTAALIGKIITELGLAKAPEPTGASSPSRVIHQVANFAASVREKLKANPPTKWTPDQRASLEKGLQEIRKLLDDAEKELNALPEEPASETSDEKS